MSNSYKNCSLKQISEKFPDIKLNDIKNKFVVPVGEIAERLGIKIKFTLGFKNHDLFLR